jgi:hypothetical protein
MSLTNQEIVEMQHRHKRLSERSKTIVAELRKDRESNLGFDEGHHSQLLFDAAEVIQWLQEQNAQLRKEVNDAFREGQRGSGGGIQGRLGG